MKYDLPTFGSLPPLCRLKEVRLPLAVGLFMILESSVVSFMGWRLIQLPLLTIPAFEYMRCKEKIDQYEFCIIMAQEIRYGYIYLIHERSQSLDVFKSFKAEVENQLGKKIKSIKSDCGGEYYGTYDRSGERRPRPLAKFLEERSTVPQFTMPGSPTMNGVAERQNRKLKHMVKRNARFFENVEFVGRGDKVKDIVFEEKYIDIPIGTSNIVQDFVPNSIDGTIDQDNVIERLIKEIVIEKQTATPPEPLPLRRSTRERRSA
ncbi:UNVERIFIED_CONTAM: hypothetical protein Sradi_2961300 [Sesamum radiatum]|uniref:Integrase catalytic domain-containing protein n=1 Tax=Sesamum radiatum TaxID=300843 RepID=A0AAW2RZ71_SESRA